MLECTVSCTALLMLSSFESKRNEMCLQLKTIRSSYQRSPRPRRYLACPQFGSEVASAVHSHAVFEGKFAGIFFSPTLLGERSITLPLLKWAISDNHTVTQKTQFRCVTVFFLHSAVYTALYKHTLYLCSQEELVFFEIPSWSKFQCCFRVVLRRHKSSRVVMTTKLSAQN